MDWLSKIRADKNFTQCQVAKMCNISTSYYSQIESGQRRPSVYIAKTIGTILNFDWTKFFENG